MWGQYYREGHEIVRMYDNKSTDLRSDDESCKYY
jgi:hypothetical protein